MSRDAEHIPDEIEVTPEMIQSGYLALVSHDPAFFSTPEIVEIVYRAMVSARNTEDEANPSANEEYGRASCGTKSHSASREEIR